MFHDIILLCGNAYFLSYPQVSSMSGCKVCGWKIKLMEGYTDGEKIKGKPEKQKRFYSGGIDCCYCNYFGFGGGYGAECFEVC